MSREYSHEDLLRAVSAVNDGGLKILTASKTYGVPFGTLWRRVKGRVEGDRFKRGPRTALSDKVEQGIKASILELQKNGFVLTRKEVMDLAARTDAIQESPVFKNGQPSNRWFQRFMKRHHLSLRTPENLSDARGKRTRRKPTKKQRVAAESDTSSEASKEMDENEIEFVDADLAQTASTSSEDADVGASICKAESLPTISEDAGVGASICKAEAIVSTNTEDPGVCDTICKTEMHICDDLAIKTEPTEDTYTESKSCVLVDVVPKEEPYTENQNYIIGDVKQEIPDYE